jgi:hypothetical protein
LRGELVGDRLIAYPPPVGTQRHGLTLEFAGTLEHGLGIPDPVD